MLNPYFLNSQKSEQNLIQSLVNEQLKMYGIEIYYIPRRYITKNTVIKEVIQSEFIQAYPIEAYLDSYEGYGGQGTLLSKFGIEEQDDMTLIVSRDRYENYITPLIKSVPNIQLSSRPKEGDLIYMPLGDKLFEINYVEHEQPFYQLQKNYVYTLKCQLFRYEDEVIDTGVDEIDDTLAGVSGDGSASDSTGDGFAAGYVQTLTLIGAAVTATATATICAGVITKPTITNMGGGYLTVPNVAISSAPSGGTNAVGIASISNAFVNCDGDKGGSVVAINLSNAGCGYTVAPKIVITSNSGAGAAATVGFTTLSGVNTITLTQAGTGYVSNPNIAFSSPGVGQSATGFAYANTAGIVTAIYITNPGYGYTVAPTVTFDSPAQGSGWGTGSYAFNEVVTGGSSGATARVREWNATTNTLEIASITGIFLKGEEIVGGTSGAKFGITQVQTDDINDPFADNDNIELQADGIIDFTKTNPFGMP